MNVVPISLYNTQVSEEEARATIDREMRSRGLDYAFYETSALTGVNLMEFAKQFGTYVCQILCVYSKRFALLISHSRHTWPDMAKKVISYSYIF